MTITDKTAAKYITANMESREEMQLHLIQAHLSAFVPLEILELKKQGGPAAWQFEKAAKLCPMIGTHGDAFLFGGKPGEAGRYMGQLVEVLAIMAFMPGGVTAFDLHFEARGEVKE